MFAAPPDVPTALFAGVPDDLVLADRDSAWLALNQRGRRLGSFLEGPSFDRAGNLYLVDLAHGRIFRVDAAGRFTTVADYDGEPNGLKLHRDGRIFVADHRRGILTVDRDTGNVTTVLGRDDIPGFKGPNDLIFAKNGDLYFTDQGQTGLHDPTGRLLRLTVDGRLDVVLDNVPSPNGLVLNADQSILYLAVTRANAVWRVPFHADGSLGKVGLFIQLSGSLGGPDGMAMDADDNLLVAQVGMGSVWYFSPVGEPLARIRSCAGPLTTNLAFGGPDNRTLYITESESGSVLTADMPRPGLTLYSHLD